MGPGAKAMVTHVNGLIPGDQPFDIRGKGLCLHHQSHPVFSVYRVSFKWHLLPPIVAIFFQNEKGKPIQEATHVTLALWNLLFKPECRVGLEGFRMPF